MLDKVFVGYDVIKDVLARSEEGAPYSATFSYVRGHDIENHQYVYRGGDSRFWLQYRKHNEGLFAIIGLTGLVESVYQFNLEGKKQRLKTKLLDRANAYGNYQVYDGHSIEGVLDRIYGIISELKFKDSFKDLKDWLPYRSQQVLARFGDYSALATDDNGKPTIVPEFTDTMNQARIAKDCFRNCIYCPQRCGHITILGRKELEDNFSVAYDMMEKYHPLSKVIMRELFLNAPDALYIDMALSAQKKVKQGIALSDLEKRLMTRAVVPKDAPSLLEITKMGHDVFFSDDTLPNRLMRISSFDNLEEMRPKYYNFWGVPSINAVGASHIRRLYCNALGTDEPGTGINRVYVGIESAHDLTSEFLGKDETAKDKARAINILHQAGPKVKAIIQLGMTGKRFYHKGQWIDSDDAAKETADFLAENLDPRDNVQISRFQPIMGTPLYNLHKEGKRIVPFRGDEEEEHIRMFKAYLKERWKQMHPIKVDEDYESALENHLLLQKV